MPTSPSHKLVSLAQLRAVRAEVTPAPSQSACWCGAARLRIGIGFVPLFPRERMNGFGFFLRQRDIRFLDVFGHKRIELFHHIVELACQRINASRLVVGWAPFPTH